MRIIRLGIVGCGEVTQVIHLPSLFQLRDRFRVTALCDVSPQVLAAVAARCDPGVRTYADYRDLVKDGEVDAVLVANPHVLHAGTAIAAMDAGKHVLIEKPMCVTLEDAATLAAARDRNGVTAQIGYMRRYAGAFVEAAGIVAGNRAEIRFARVHDVIGKNAFFIEGITGVVRPQDVPPDVVARTRDLERRKIEEAIGPADDRLRLSYSLLLGLGSHDISAMREMLGMPKRVLDATHRQGGRYITATLDYGDFVCQYATGIDDIPRFEAYLEVFLRTKVVRVDYDTPYIRNLPARLRVIEAKGNGVAETTSQPSRLDAFVIEWTHFHENVVGRKPPKTSIEDARQDLELFTDMIAAIRSEGCQPAA